MGCSLACGVLTRFEINRRKSWQSSSKFNLKDELDNVLKDISDIIDSSLYDLNVYDKNCYVFKLKPKIFDENIRELLEEISSLTYPNAEGFCDFKGDKMKIDLNDKENEKKFFCNCKVEENGKYLVEMKDKEAMEDYPLYPFYWIFKDEKLFYNVEISGTIIMIWEDFFKYNGDDETNMLRIMNNMKSKYYNSKLSKAFIYYVSG